MHHIFSQRLYFIIFAFCALLQVGISYAAPPPMSASNIIMPGARWLDTAGNVIQAHGGGMLQVGNTYYWFGEDRGGTGAVVSCYSSTDLAHWMFRNHVVTRQKSGDLGPGRVVERPKVLYNRPTHLYVMYLHIDSPNYGEAKVGVATCATVDGQYTYRGSFQPLGHESRDMTLFQDTDGSGYLLHEDRKRGIAIVKLTPDFLNVDHEVALIHEALEAPAMLHVGDTYFLLGSSLSGWNANPNHYATAPSLAGPWSAFADVAPHATNTYDSQTAFILPVVGSQTTTFIYGGDRWNKGQNLQDARYVWLPLQLQDYTLKLAPNNPWSLDVKTGLAGAVRWTPLIPMGDYHLTNRQSGLLVDIVGGSTQNSAALITAPASKAPSQLWHVAPAGYNAYTITNKSSGKVMDVLAGSRDADATIAQYEANGGVNQLWNIIPTNEGYYAIVNQNSEQQLTVRGAPAKPDGATVVQRPAAHSAAQEWQIAK